MREGRTRPRQTYSDGVPVNPSSPPKGDHALVAVDRLLALFDEPSLVVDGTGITTAGNDAAHRLLVAEDDRSRRERPFEDWVDPHDRSRWREFLQRLATAAGGSQSLSTRVRLHGAGRHVRAVIHGMGLPLGSGAGAFLLVLRVDDEHHGTAGVGPAALTARAGLSAGVTDPLTGLETRALVSARLEQLLAGSPGRPVALLQLDLEEFRHVNDAHGQGVGDMVLIALAERLQACIDDPALVARTGGDEFVVLLSELPTRRLAEQTAEHLLDALRLPFPIGGREIQIAASLGIALGRAGEVSADELLRQVHIATSEAKRVGGGHSVFFHPGLQAAVVEQAQLVEQLGRALYRGDLALHFQPIVHVETGEVSAVEALIRWRHPTRGLLGGEAFIPLAERVGMIGQIDRWVLETATRAAGRWGGRLASLPVSVNLSARSVSSATLCLEVESALAGSGLPAERLIIELTETALFDDTEVAAEQLVSLKALGVWIALDDFGTGYTSLAHLERFPLDVLKFDRSYARRIAGDLRAEAILATMLQLADTLGIATLMEGIEHPDDVTMVRSLGVDFAQGYQLGKPVPETSLEAAVSDADARGRALRDAEGPLHGPARVSVRDGGPLGHGALGSAPPLAPTAGQLQEALSTLTSTVEHDHPDIAVTVEADAVTDVGDAAAVSAVYSIIDEAVTNAVRHAKASRIDVTMHRIGHTVEVAVHDDGVGFESTPMQPDVLAGRGLEAMRDRARLAGGILRVRSARGEGTTVRALIPDAPADLRG